MADMKQDASKLEGEAKGLWTNSWHPKGTGKKSPKSWLVTLLLTIILGELGIGRFYVGKWKTGLIQLVLCWTFVWWILDIVRVATNVFTDSKGNIISRK